MSLQRKSEVARFDGIILADPEGSLLFRNTVLSALQLVKNVDKRRFLRIQRYMAWIVNCPLPFGGAVYHYPTRTCRMDFTKPAVEPDPEFAAAIIARTLVHEATHGFLFSRNFGYAGELRSRVEHCCHKEECRFVARLSISNPEVAKLLRREFVESRWHLSWSATPLQKLSALVRRLSSVKTF